MKHALSYLHDDMICTLRHSNLLRCMWGRCLLLDTMIFQKMIKCLRNELPAIVQPKRFDFVLRLCVYECLELLELLKAISFGFQNIQSHLY